MKRDPDCWCQWKNAPYDDTFWCTRNCPVHDPKGYEDLKKPDREYGQDSEI